MRLAAKWRYVPRSVNRPHVALLIETSTNYGREIIAGIAAHLRTHGEWTIFLDQREERSPVPEWLTKWDGDGVICRWTTPDLAKVLRKLRQPVVDLNDRYGYLGFPRVGSDMVEIGRMAATHLLERGFSNIAFCGFREMRWSDLRRQGVESAVEGRGRFCGSFDSDINAARTSHWEEERERIATWVKALPRPVGIVACNDVRGNHILQACIGLDLVVPEEVAVVGVDNAELYCEISSPPLSSVRPNSKRVGAEAAALLNRLMTGQSAEVEELLIPPAEVVTRRSSDVLAIPDRLVARAVELIRKRACEGLRVEDLVSTLATQRPLLERGFRKHLHRTPHEEIRRVRLERVKQLLLETDWTLERIAEATGFEHPEYLTVQFKRIIGETPSRWRTASSVPG